MTKNPNKASFSCSFIPRVSTTTASSAYLSFTLSVLSRKSKQKGKIVCKYGTALIYILYIISAFLELGLSIKVHDITRRQPKYEVLDTAGTSTNITSIYRISSKLQYLTAGVALFHTKYK